MISRAGLMDAVRQKFMSDSELASAYKNAKCFVYPSLYEGFGMPILEAFSFGCPIALSNASCFPEIAGDAGIYFDGNDSDDIARQVHLIWEMDGNSRSSLIQRGYKQLSLFSWDRATEETLKAYRKAML